MFGIPVWLIARAAAALAVALLVAWLYHMMAEHFREQGRAELRPEVAALRASIEETQRRASALALLWSAQVDKTEAAAHQSEVNRAQTFADLQNDARRAAGAGAAHFSGVAVGLLERARSAASSETTGPSAKSAEAPAPAPDATAWGIAMYEWAAVCTARVHEWEQFYAGLQAGTQ